MKEYRLTINGKPYDVAVKSHYGEEAEVSVNGKDYKVIIEEKTAQCGGSDSAVNATAKTVPVSAPSKANGAKVTSPLPGIIVDICVKAGDKVAAGTKVAVLEAMKMENDILAEADGTVAQVCVSKGDSVPEGAEIIKFE